MIEHGPFAARQVAAPHDGRASALPQVRLRRAELQGAREAARPARRARAGSAASARGACPGRARSARARRACRPRATSRWKRGRAEVEVVLVGAPGVDPDRAQVAQRLARAAARVRAAPGRSAATAAQTSGIELARLEVERQVDDAVVVRRVRRAHRVRVDEQLVVRRREHRAARAEVRPERVERAAVAPRAAHAPRARSRARSRPRRARRRRASRARRRGRAGGAA